MTAGQRVRILKDNGRDGIVGFEGKIVMMAPSGVVVNLDSDPALGRNMYNPGGNIQVPQGHIVMRFFLLGEVEVI